MYFNGQLCIELDKLWQALYQSFNSAQDHQINIKVLDKIPSKPALEWTPFLKEKFKSAIAKCSNSSTSGLDRVSWKHLKCIVKDDLCLNIIVNITNTCINLGHWPSHFKMLLSIIISKSNKTFYNSPKFFCPIVLLNMLGKLIEKAIGERMQFQVISKILSF